MKAPWGVAAAGRVAANNGSALHFGHGSEGRASLRRGAGRFVNKAKAVRGNSNNRRLTQPSVDELTGCGERKSAGTSIAHRSDLTHARHFASASVPTEPAGEAREGTQTKNRAAQAAETTSNLVARSADSRGGRKPFFPGAVMADSTATYLNSHARPTSARAGSFAVNQQTNRRIA